MCGCFWTQKREMMRGVYNLMCHVHVYNHVVVVFCFHFFYTPIAVVIAGILKHQQFQQNISKYKHLNTCNVFICKYLLYDMYNYRVLQVPSTTLSILILQSSQKTLATESPSTVRGHYMTPTQTSCTKLEKQHVASRWIPPPKSVGIKWSLVVRKKHFPSEAAQIPVKTFPNMGPLSRFVTGSGKIGLGHSIFLLGGFMLVAYYPRNHPRIKGKVTWKNLPKYTKPPTNHWAIGWLPHGLPGRTLLLMQGILLAHGQPVRPWKRFTFPNVNRGGKNQPLVSWVGLNTPPLSNNFWLFWGIVLLWNKQRSMNLGLELIWPSILVQPPLVSNGVRSFQLKCNWLGRSYWFPIMCVTKIVPCPDLLHS